jgi:hypothetical protein
VDIGRGTEAWGRELAGKIPAYIEGLESYAASVADNPLLAALPIAGVALVGSTAALTPVGIHHAKHSLTGSPSDLNVGDRLEKGVDEWFSMPIWLKFSDRCMHTMLIGPTGSGKTTALLPWLIQDLAAGRSAVIVQVQGDFAEEGEAYARALGAEVLKFDLQDPDNSLKLNPLVGKNTEEVAERMAAAMRAAVGEQSHFEAVAEDVTRNTTILARQYSAHKGYSESDANLQLMEMLLLDRDFLEEVLDATPVTDDKGKPTGRVRVNAPWLDPYVATWFEQDFLRWNSTQLQQNTIGVKMVLHRIIGQKAVCDAMCPAPEQPVLDLAKEIASTAHRSSTAGENPSGSQQGSRNQLPRRGKLIIINAHGAGQQPASSIAHLAIKTIEDATGTRTKKSEPLCVYLDELPTLVGDGHRQALKDFNSWLATVRKLQVAVTVAFQGWAQLPKMMADTIDTNCRNKLISGGGSTEDIERLKRMLGEEREVMSESVTPGSMGPDQVRSRSRRKEERSRLTYDQILRLRREEWIWMGTRDGANLAPVKLRTSPPKPLKTYSKRNGGGPRRPRKLKASRQRQRALPGAPSEGSATPEPEKTTAMQSIKQLRARGLW